MILKKMQQFDQVRTTEEIATSTTKYKEFTPIVCSWSITDTDSVLCASEDCVTLQSIRNTSIAPTWQFRL